MRAKLALAWILFLSSVAVLIFAACNGIVALEQGRLATAAVNGGFVLFNVGLIGVQTRIIDDLNTVRAKASS